MAISSVADLEPVTHITTRLQALLEKAKNVKPETTLEPPLSINDLIADVDRLHDGFAAELDQALKYDMTDYAMRDIFYTLINSLDIDDPSFVQVWNLLDIINVCSDRELCEPRVLLYLIEELLDSQTTSGSWKVFDYLESRGQRLFAKNFSKKHIVILRACNELLRRLSRAEDAIFCGRVFFFLFQTFPLGDKSSVNARGEFHTENVTTYESPPPASNENSGEMEVDQDFAKTQEPSQETKASTPQPPTKPGAKAVPAAKASKPVVEEVVLSNSKLYPVFWRLQQDFSDPTSLFKDDNFATFKKGLTYTLTKFRKTTTVAQTKPAEDSRSLKRKLGQDGTTPSAAEHSEDVYNPKYLTSQDLFDLELADLAFQRHIMVQALILLEFLLSLTEKVKIKRLASVTASLTTEEGTKLNNSMMYNFTLSPEDAEWASSFRSTISSYLQSTSDGRFFHRMVETVLARDKNWVQWKLKSCPPILRDPVSVEQEMEARIGARNATRVRKLPPRPQGAMDLSFLADGEGGGLEALKKPHRFTAPTVGDLIKGVKTDELDLEMAMDDEEKTGYENAISNKTWRALRQVRATALDKLDKVEPGKDLEEALRPKVSTEEVHEATDGTDGVAPTVVVSDEKSTAEATGDS